MEEAPKKSGTLLEGGVDDDASSKIIRYLRFHGDETDSRSVVTEIDGAHYCKQEETKACSRTLLQCGSHNMLSFILV